MLYTDTDSLIYEIGAEDFYRDIAGDVEMWFDTSEFDASHSSGIRTGVNKKVIGMMKDEAGGKIIQEFVGLRAKQYSFKMWEDSFEHKSKRCKGIRKNVVKKHVTHDDYKNCLLNREEQMRNMNVIRSHLHDVYTEEVNKVALSVEDDNRVIMENGIHTLAYGHYSRKKTEGGSTRGVGGGQKFQNCRFYIYLSSFM